MERRKKGREGGKERRGGRKEGRERGKHDRGGREKGRKEGDPVYMAP